MTFTPPEMLNVTDWFLDARIREGKGENTALLTEERSLSYHEVQALANRYGNVLREAGVQPEQRVLIALPDGPEFVAALFGTIKVGGVVVMVNPELPPDAVAYFLDYTRATAVLTAPDSRAAFESAASPHLRELLVIGTEDFDRRIAGSSAELDCFPSHRDDAAIWLFSGGTTGRPKAVVQTHRSFANTTELYAKGVLRYSEDDVTLSVPKLYFGYATGSNLLFPFSVGATAALFPERCTPECLFEKVARFQPTILVNVPTMIHKMVAHESAPSRDLGCLRLATSAGEALPPELHDRWRDAFGVELLDGLGTAEMWHVFLSNRPGEVRPGTLGRAVPGFDVIVCDDDGRELPSGEIGWLHVRGDSRAIGYWQQMDKTRQAFRGDWYVSGDMVSRDEDGFFTYHGRGDDMLKVSGKWLSPGELENCLVQHPSVEEAAVVGIADEAGLLKPHAFVVAAGAGAGLEEELKRWTRERLEPYKTPRTVRVLDAFPRTHLGKIDRGRLKKLAGARSPEDAGQPAT